MGKRQQEFVLPLSPDRRPSWDHLGLELGQLGRRPLVSRHVVVETFEEEEEEESPGEDRQGHLYSSREAAMAQSFHWAHWSSLSDAAAAAAAAAVAAAIAAAAAAALSCASVETWELVGVF